MAFTKAMPALRAEGAHFFACAFTVRREPTMKPLWTQTLAWIVAVLAAVLLALATPDGLGIPFQGGFSHGANAPR
jgi:hypothetical protein